MVCRDRLRPLLASLPSRGAWIEMASATWKTSWATVAPLAGSVDRNIVDFCGVGVEIEVAPLAGSVDRNPGQYFRILGSVCRSPRGERG